MNKGILLFLIFSAQFFCQTTYTWNTSSGNWTAAASWNPVRTTPSVTDILVFDGNVIASATVTLMPRETVAKLRIINNASVSITSSTPTAGTGTITKSGTTITGSASAVFNTFFQIGDYLYTSTSSNMSQVVSITDNTHLVSGESGTISSGTAYNRAASLFITSADGFYIEAGSSLTLACTTPTMISIAHNAAGSVMGNLTVNGTANKILAADADGLIFNYGSVFTSGTTASSNTPHGITNVNSIVFKYGARYITKSAATPFLSANPVTVVVFQPGSWFSHQNSNIPIINGKTYANFEINYASLNVTSATGTSTFQADTLTITSCTGFNFALTGGIIIKGNINVLAGAVSFNPTAANTLTLSGSSPQSINLSGGSLAFGSNLTMDVNNISGVILNTPVTISGLTLTNGYLTSTSSNLLTLTSSAIVTGGGSSSYIDGPVTQSWSTSTASKTYPLGKGGLYRPLTISLTTPLSAVIKAELFNSNPGGTIASGVISSIRHYQTSLISGSASSGGSVQLTFGSDDGVTAGVEGNLFVAQAATVNGNYTNLGNSAFTSSTVTSSSYDPSLGNYIVLGSSSGNPLPVELISFTAEQLKDGVSLNWTTATELNNNGFRLERSKDKLDWKEIVFIAGAGNSNSIKQYHFTDQKINGNGNYSYRLIQKDNNGISKVSGQLDVNFNLPVSFSLSQNYPNPFNPSTRIDYAIPEASLVKISVYNILGKEIAQLENGYKQQGFYSVYFNAADVSSGVYLYKIEAGKFSQVKSMTLIK